MSRSQALAQRRRQRPTWRRDRPTWSAISGLLKPSKAQRMMEARCRNCDEAVGALETVRRMSCCRSVMMILAVLPGMVRDLLMNGDLAKPGNFSREVNLLVAQLRLVGLGCREPLPGSRGYKSFTSQGLCINFVAFGSDPNKRPGLLTV